MLLSTLMFTEYTYITFFVQSLHVFDYNGLKVFIGKGYKTLTQGLNHAVILFMYARTRVLTMLKLGIHTVNSHGYLITLEAFFYPYG